ncbi:MAG: hypothetical protein E7047_00815 [Lentisphaerae bacterium]|nr:hypothetical protein [Lentisphaerota bacterium]
MLKQLFTAGLAAAAFSAMAAAEITVSSTPALPAQNLLKNASFEDGKLAPWRPFGGTVAIDGATQTDGANSFKIVGDPAKSPGLSQYIRPADIPLKAKDLYYIKFKAKNTGCDIDKRPGGVAWQAVYSDGTKPSYMRTPELPREDYDWTEFEMVNTIPHDLKTATFYLCYYKQEGEQWFDEVVFQGGSTELTLNVKGDDVKQVVVLHSQTGKILDEKVADNSFSKTIKVPAFGSYEVIAIDSNGVRTSKLYPENVDVNTAVKNNNIPLTLVKRMLIPFSKAETFNIELPADIAGKKVYLDFTGRIDQLTTMAGFTAGVKIKVNSKQCGAKELIKPANKATTSSGSDLIFARSAGYVLYYSNASYNISEDNHYCPVTLKDRNPFNFRLDVTQLVKPGMNKIEFINPFAAKYPRTIAIENAQVVIE